MINAGVILKDALNRLGIDLRIKSYQILYVWDKAVGPYISSVACPENVKFKTLFVNVRDNVWLNQLKFLEPMIIDKLNETVGEKIISKIYFKLGEVKSREFRTVSQKLKTGERWVNSRLPAPDPLHLPDINLSFIKDTDLRKIIQRVIFKSGAAVKKT